MFVAKYRKKDSYYCLWNRLPQRVKDNENQWRREHDMSELCYDSHHGYTSIDSRFTSIFEGKEYPIEVELVRDDSEEPMFYAQKFLDAQGNEFVYISHHLEYKYHVFYMKGHFFWKKRVKGVIWHSSLKAPTEDYADLSVNVCKYNGMRMRPRDFKWSVDDGYVPVKIQIKH